MQPLRLQSLYRDAVAACWIEDSEAAVRNFLGAALRATRAAGRYRTGSVRSNNPGARSSRPSS
jgi:hypothetical protein